MAEKKSGKKKQAHQALFLDDICYRANPKSLPVRCSNRIHYYAESRMKPDDQGSDYYDVVYGKVKGLTFSSLGSVGNFEDLLNALNDDLKKSANTGKMIGDFVILTHGITKHLDGRLVTVTIKLPLLNTMKHMDTQKRKLDPVTTKWVFTELNAQELDAQEIENLHDKGSDLYDLVERVDKTGLVSVVVKNIVSHMDGSTNIWFAGCNLGLNPGLLKAMRGLFDDKPVIFGFSRRHFIYVTWDSSHTVDGGIESLIGPGKASVRLWTESSLRQIRREPVLTISGYLRDSNGQGVSGVVMKGLPKNPKTDGDGLYTVVVDYGWFGTVVPTKKGSKFNPKNHKFSLTFADATKDFTCT